MSRETELKEKFTDAAKISISEGNSNTVYTFEMIQALRDMAENNVYPDWHFGDTDCNVWEMFHNFHKK